jgi:hypothetical protein
MGVDGGGGEGGEGIFACDTEFCVYFWQACVYLVSRKLSTHCCGAGVRGIGLISINYIIAIFL